MKDLSAKVLKTKRRKADTHITVETSGALELVHKGISALASCHSATGSSVLTVSEHVDSGTVISKRTRESSGSADHDGMTTRMKLGNVPPVWAHSGATWYA